MAAAAILTGLGLPASASATFTPLGTWSTTFTSPDAIAIAPDASGAAQGVWISENTGSMPGDDAQEFAPTGTLERTIASTFTCQMTNETFDFPDGLAVDPATGDLFVADEGNSRVIEFGPTGGFLAQIGSGEISTTCGVPATDTAGANPAYFDEPAGLSVGAGALLVAEPGATGGTNKFVDAIPVPLSGSNLRVNTFADNGDASQAGYDTATSHVYVADGSASNSILEYSSSGSFLSEWGPVFAGGVEFADPSPQWLAIDPVAGILYADDHNSGVVNAFDIYTGALLQQLTGLDSPEGLAVDPVSHVLYIVEQGSTNSVTRYSYTPAPACTPATATSNADAQASLPLSCTDQAGAPLTYAIAQQPSHGSASINPSTGQATYTPAGGYTGNDSFTYTASSIDGTSQPATVSVAVPPPSCATQSIATGYEAALSVALSCSGNSTAAASFKVITQPADGTLSTPSSTGALTYTPNETFAGSDSFTFEGVSSTGQVSAPVTITIDVGAPLPTPVAGQSSNIFYASGTVTVTLPGQHTPVALTAGMQVPLGSIINATHGRVGVFVANAAGVQSADFYNGEFRLTQAAGAHPAAASDNFAILSLLGRRIRKPRCAVYGHSFSGSFKLLALAKRQSPGFHEKRKPVRQLWGDGHGNFTTVGNGSSTSVRGTIWAIFDYPDGTLTRVYTDSVAVYDNHLRKTVVVRAGHFYFAALGNLPTCR